MPDPTYSAATVTIIILLVVPLAQAMQARFNTRRQHRFRKEHIGEWNARLQQIDVEGNVRKWAEQTLENENADPDRTA